MQGFKTTGCAVAGNVFHIRHAQSGFNQGFNADFIFQTLLHFQLVQHRFNHIHIGINTDFRNQNRVNFGAALLDQIDHVTHHILRVQTVNAHRHGNAVAFPVEVVNRFDNVFSGLQLVIGRYRIFKIQKNKVRATFHCFFKHFRARTRNG